MIIITTKSMEKSVCTAIKNVMKNRNVTDSKKPP